MQPEAGLRRALQRTEAGQAAYDRFYRIVALCLVVLVLLCIAAIYLWRRLKLNKSLPRGFSYHFFIATAEASDADAKTKLLRDWMRPMHFKAWDNPVARLDDKLEGVRSSMVFVVFLAPGSLDCPELVRCLVEAVDLDRPIVLVHDPGFDFDEDLTAANLPPRVENEILPRLIDSIESIEFTFRSVSPLVNKNATMVALETAFFRRDEFIYSHLSRTGEKVSVLIPDNHDMAVAPSGLDSRGHSVVDSLAGAPPSAPPMFVERSNVQDLVPVHSTADRSSAHSASSGSDPSSRDAPVRPVSTKEANGADNTPESPTARHSVASSGSAASSVSRLSGSRHAAVEDDARSRSSSAGPEYGGPAYEL